MLMILRIFGISLVQLFLDQLVLELVLFLLDALLDFDHLGLAQIALAHGPQRAEPAEDRKAVAQSHRDPEDASGGIVAGLGQRGRVADEGNARRGNERGEGGHDLVDQAVGAGDDGRDILAAAIQLEVDNIGHEGGIGGGAGHHKAVAHQREQNVEHHRDAEMGDRVRTDGEPGDREEGDDGEVCVNAVLRQVDDGLLVAVLAAVPRSNDREDD